MNLIYCCQCDQSLTSDLFGSNKSRPSGKNHYCKECVRKISKSRSEYHAKWRSKNRDKVNAGSRAWVSKNSEKRKAIVRAYEATLDPTVRVAITNRYRAKKLGVKHISYDPLVVYAKHNNKCFYCGSVANSLDHVIPISRGGDDAEYNLVAACIPCNSSKHNKTLEEWQQTA